MKRLGFVWFLLALTSGLLGQPDSIRMMKYDADFRFNDGIYPNFDLVKANSPIPASRIVSDVDLYDRDFYDKVTSEDQIIFYDNFGVKQTLATKNIWGYSRNGILYINVGQSFHRISFIGNICHFVASITTYNSNYYDPYGYNPYYYSPYYYDRYRSPRAGYANTELRQYLMDFETGDVLDYEVESVEVLLMRDPELHDEYVSLRRRKQNQLKFVYIRKYNEKHPLYIPVN